MKTLKEFISESAQDGSDIEKKVSMSRVSDRHGNVNIQGQHKGMTVVRDSRTKGEYTSFRIHGHSNPDNKHVSVQDKSDAHITHYHYRKNAKPSYIPQAKHDDLMSKGRYVVKAPNRWGNYDGAEHHYHKTAASALKHAKEIATKNMAQRSSDALGAAATYSHRNFSQTYDHKN